MGLIPPWADLPVELLSAICECLHSNPIDILAFRSVCKSWLSSSSLSSAISPSKLFPPFPLIIPSPPYRLCHLFYIPTDKPTTTILSATTVYALHPPTPLSGLPSSTWLLLVDQHTPGGKLTIRQPFNRFPYALPINFPRTLNLLSFHATQLYRFYHLTVSKPSVWYGSMRKLVIFSNNYAVALSDDGQLGLLSLHNNKQWDIIHPGKGFRFDDLVDFKGRLLGIDRRGRVYHIDLSSSCSTIRVIVPSIAGGGGRRKRLVESSGCMHMLVRCNSCKETDALFKVYQLNEGTRKWVEVKSLVDRTFFLGHEFSFSASPEELQLDASTSSIGKNHIVFQEGSFLNYNGYDGDSALFRGLGFYDLHIGVWSSEEVAHLGVIGSYPGLSNLLWPPPFWIWPTNKSERLGSLLTKLDLLLMRIPNETLKDEFKKLSPRQQEGAIELSKQAVRLKKLLVEVRGRDEKMKSILRIALSLLQYCNSENLQNQVVISTLGAEELHVCVDILKKAMKQINLDFDWYTMEVKLHSSLFELEDTTTDLENALKAHNL